MIQLSPERELTLRQVITHIEGMTHEELTWYTLGLSHEYLELVQRYQELHCAMVALTRLGQEMYGEADN